ncbi:FG-GAP repeat protein [Streptomyces sp. M19]
MYEDADTPQDFDVIVVPGSESGRTTAARPSSPGRPRRARRHPGDRRPVAAHDRRPGRGRPPRPRRQRRRPGAVGQPQGPRADGGKARVRMPGSGYLTAPIAGDFDGDGHTDLVAFGSAHEGAELVVLRGRSSAPAPRQDREDPQPGPRGRVSRAGRRGRERRPRHRSRPVRLPWDPPLLLTGGARTASGLSAKPERLPKGENVVFGDFDGDGRQDVAVGRSFVDIDDELDTPTGAARSASATGRTRGSGSPWRAATSRRASAPPSPPATSTATAVTTWPYS